MKIIIKISINFIQIMILSILNYAHFIIKNYTTKQQTRTLFYKMF